MRKTHDDELDFLSSIFMLALFAAVICGWLTHVIHCLLAGKYLLLIAGAFIFPVGIIHGIGLWFGVNW